MNKRIISLAFGLLMVSIYGAMGYLLLFSSLFDRQFPLAIRVVFGIVFVAYGLFRAYRIIYDYHEK